MASSPSNFISESAAMEKFIAEFLAKSVHVILESRSPCVSARKCNAEPFSSASSSSPSVNIRPRDNWFNLALRNCPAALESFDMWRQSNREPLVIDIVLDRRKAVRDSSCASPGGVFVRNLSSGRDDFEFLNRSEKIVERWIVKYESQSVSQPRMESSYRGSKKWSSASNHSSKFQVMYKKAYRRITVLIRSLYTVVRLLPAHKLFRDLNASGQIHPFMLSYKISSIAEPFSREEDAEMSQHDFGPLDIFVGELSVSVTYLKTLESVSSGPSTPITTEFILDYVGSPLVNPLNRLRSLPTDGSEPLHAALGRRHSWSNDHAKAPSFSPTPSSTYSDSQVLYHNSNSRLPPCLHLPEKTSASLCSITHVSFARHATNVDQCLSSPPYSASSSPSSRAHLCRSFLHSERASFSIPLPRHEGSDGGENQGLSLSTYYKSKRQGWPSQMDTLGTQEKTPSAPKTFLPGKLQLKIELLRFMEFQAGMTPPKIASNGGDSAVDLTGLKTVVSSPRNSSRLWFMAEFDDFDFVCPFAEDDVVTNSCRVESANSKDHVTENLCPGKSMPIQRSPDAAVGELVWMLRSAPPLRLNNSNILKSMQCFKDKVSSQKTQQGKIENIKENDLKSRTAADAFKELRTYKSIRELILKHSGPIKEKRRLNTSSSKKTERR